MLEFHTIPDYVRIPVQAVRGVPVAGVSVSE